MVLKVAALLVGTLAATGFASPTPVSEKKTCTTIYPSFLQIIKSTDPDKSFRNAANSLVVQQDQTNANTPDRILQYIDFEVPNGPEVWGCQLHVTDQNRAMTWTNSTSGQKAPAMNVIALEPNSVSDFTYNKILNSEPPIISARYFGYFALAPGGHSTINAEGCPASTSNGNNGHLGFVLEFEYAGWKGNMEWSLPQKVSGDNGVAEGEDSGVYISYGECWT